MADEQHGKISRKAYEIWESHGRPHGKDEEHWAAAVKAVETEDAAPAKKSRAKAAKAEVSIPESAKTEPVATEAERHVELPVSTTPDMQKPKRGKAAVSTTDAEKKPSRTKKV